MALTEQEEKELRDQLAETKQAAKARRRAISDDDAADDSEPEGKKPVNPNKQIAPASESSVHATLEEVRSLRSELAEQKGLLAGVLGSKKGKQTASPVDEPSFLARIFGATSKPAASPSPGTPAPAPAPKPVVDNSGEEPGFLESFFRW